MPGGAAPGVLAAACVGFAVPTTRVGLLPFSCAVAALVVPRFAGRRWVLPGALLATVGSWTLYAYPAFTDALGLLAAHYLVLRVVDFLPQAPPWRTAAPKVS